MDFPFIGRHGTTHNGYIFIIESMNKHFWIREKFDEFGFVFICLSHFDTRNSQLLGYSLFGSLGKFAPCAWCLNYITCRLSEYGNMDNVFAVWMATLTMRAICYSTEVMQRKKKKKIFCFGLLLSLILCVNAMSLQRLNRCNMHLLLLIFIIINQWPMA